MRLRDVFMKRLYDEFCIRFGLKSIYHDQTEYPHSTID
jgi:hypothetical protein